MEEGGHLLLFGEWAIPEKIQTRRGAGVVEDGISRDIKEIACIISRS